MELESRHEKQSKASSRRQSLVKKGWTAVTTRKSAESGGFEVWGTPPAKAEVPAIPLPASPEAAQGDGAVKGAPAEAPRPPAPQTSGTPKPKAAKRTPPAPGPRKDRTGIKLKNPGPRSRPKGATSGAGVEGTWVKVFERNEQLADGKKLSDKQITAYMNSEFPGRGSLVFNAVANVRAKYNRGGLTKGVKPKVQSQCYGD